MYLFQTVVPNLCHISHKLHAEDDCISECLSPANVTYLEYFKCGLSEPESVGFSREPEGVGLFSLGDDSVFQLY